MRHDLSAQSDARLLEIVKILWITTHIKEVLWVMTTFGNKLWVRTFYDRSLN